MFVSNATLTVDINLFLRIRLWPCLFFYDIQKCSKTEVLYNLVCKTFIWNVSEIWKLQGEPLSAEQQAGEKEASILQSVLKIQADYVTKEYLCFFIYILIHFISSDLL